MPKSFLQTRYLILPLIAAALTACGSPATTKVKVNRPEPGRESCFFNETSYNIGVDFDRGEIKVCPDKTIIFHPPTSCDPKKAHQVRWVVKCLNGEESCMREGDLLIIRPKKAPFDKASQSSTCRLPEEIELRKAEKDALCAPKRASFDLEEPDEESMRQSFAQRYSMFNPEASGFFAIPAGHESVVSGIPNAKFERGNISLGWYYEIVLQRDDKVVACLDPDIWIERDEG